MSKWIKLITQETTHAEEDSEQGEHFLLQLGVQITVESNMMIPQKIWNQSTLRHSYTTFGQFTQWMLHPTKRTLAQLCSLQHYS